MGKKTKKKKYHIGQVVFKDEKEKNDIFTAIKFTGNTFSAWVRRLILSKVNGINETN